jgi:deoxyribonucleoside regulator
MQNGDKIARLVEIATAYYYENRTQSEIAASMGVTRSQISRYLKEARELGIVEIHIMTPVEQPGKLGDQILKLFPHLKDVVIAPTYSAEIETNRSIVGRYAANYLLQVLQPGQCLAIGCGRTLRAMVNALQHHEIANVCVVQAMGNIGHEAHGIDYNEIALQAARAFNARHHYISSPAILGNGSGKASELVMANPTIKAALDLARHAQVYIVGLGSLESDQLYAQAGLIEQSSLDDLRQRAVGDICGRFFDLAGSEVTASFSDRTVGIELADLHNAHLSIGVATGQDKIAPLLGALHGQWINVLICDEKTAQGILSGCKGSSPSESD